MEAAVIGGGYTERRVPRGVTGWGNAVDLHAHVRGIGDRQARPETIVLDGGVAGNGTARRVQGDFARRVGEIADDNLAAGFRHHAGGEVGRCVASVRVDGNGGRVLRTWLHHLSIERDAGVGRVGTVGRVARCRAQHLLQLLGAEAKAEDVADDLRNVVRHRFRRCVGDRRVIRVGVA